MSHDSSSVKIEVYSNGLTGSENYVLSSILHSSRTYVSSSSKIQMLMIFIASHAN